jgi:hypothetical protein
MDSYTARALLRERFLALEGEGIAWMGQPSRQGIALVRIEFWRSTPCILQHSGEFYEFYRFRFFRW